MGRVKASASIAAGLAIAVVAAGCGGPSEAEREAQRTTQVRYLANGVRTWQLEQRRTAATKAWKTCVKQLARLRADVESFEDARQKEMFLDDYTGYATSIVRELDRIEIAALSDDCLAVVAPLEKASNIYSANARLWAACNLTSPSYCDYKRQLFPLMEKGESEAVDLRKHADAALKRMRTNPPAGVPKAGGYTTAVPQSAGDVEQSVYGLAVRAYCGHSMNVAAAEACASLREILTNGVESGEFDDLDHAVKQLTEAENLLPADGSSA